MKKSTTRRLLALCLCLCLVSVSLVGGTLARYVTTGNASDTVTTASWVPTITIDGVDATETHEFTLDETNAPLHPGMTDISVPVKVINNSDFVDANATVKITLTNPVTNMTVEYDGETVTSGTEYTKTYEVTRGATGATKNLVFSWPYGESAVDNDFAGKEVKVQIDVTLEQTTGKTVTT